MQNLISIYMQDDITGHSGRVFCYPDVLKNISYKDLAAEFSRKFIDDDDDLDVRKQVIESGLHYVTVFDGEEPPAVKYAYLEPDENITGSVFLCVLGSIYAVQDLLKQEKFVFETCNFQVVGSNYTQNSIMAGLEEWKRRVWPCQALPKLTFL